MLWGDRFIRHDLRVCDEVSVTISHKDEVYLRLGVPTIERDKVGVAFTKHGVHYGHHDNGDVLRRYICCLLIKQAPKLILDLIGTASLRSMRREEVEESLLSGDNDLHQSIVKALDAYN
ncbi:unnamed protein product [Heligmosomoides polygyrus]|uniref:HECT domain-containing protein n=1 Tax=Heligmosomoides polygyrus TaxID=6339 RepID=A0A183GQG6_HELPZ|nr:unnamed protein product [Heligmosomoides polygyrus]